MGRVAEVLKSVVGREKEKGRIKESVVEPVVSSEAIETAAGFKRELEQRLSETPEFADALSRIWFNYYHSNWHPTLDFTQIDFKRNGVDYEIHKSSPSYYRIYRWPEDKPMVGFDKEVISIFSDRKNGSFTYVHIDREPNTNEYFTSNVDPKMAEIKVREFMSALGTPAK